MENINEVAEVRESVEQKVINPPSGLLVLVVLLALTVACPVLIIYGIASWNGLWAVLLGIVLAIVLPFLYMGLRSVRPNEALVLTLFGKYYGTIIKPGFFFVNPFARYNNPAYEAQQAAELAATMEGAKEGAKEGKVKVRRTSTSHVRKTVSTKRSTLDNGTQKVNDALGNPIIIGAIVLWHVEDPTKAVFNVENYEEFLSIQTDTTIRNTARLYPYDVFDDADDDEGVTETTLRGSSQEIAAKMKTELAEKAAYAGIVIEEVRITHIAYAEEIAAAMLQRQQAAAIISARTKIVDGAVGMVKMAIDRLEEDDVVGLDEERKAQMVSNLLVVLCGNTDAQPVINSGSLY